MNDKIAKLTPEQIRKKQIEMLQKLSHFFDEHNIRYYAFCGTLLGAVRHKGFIPWDNDIDIAVPRADYIRLQSLLKNEDANDLFRFLCYENDHRYLWQFGKIVAKGTMMKTKGGYSKLGLFIDIFPLDSQGDDYDEALRNVKDARNCARLRAMAYDKKYKGEYSYPKKCTPEEIKELRILFEDQNLDTEEYWVRQNILLAQKYSGMDHSVYYGCNSNEKYAVVCERSFFDTIEYLDFEDIKVPAPAGYEEILHRYYGNYMVLPSKDKQVGLLETNIYAVEE